MFKSASCPKDTAAFDYAIELGFFMLEIGIDFFSSEIVQ